MDPHMRNKDEWTPFLFAVNGGNHVIAKYLIEECGATISANADDNKRIGTVLHIIANRNGIAWPIGDRTKYRTAYRPGGNFAISFKFFMFACIYARAS